MTHVAKEIKRLIEEGEKPSDVADALGFSEEAVSSMVGSMVERGEIRTPKDFAIGRMDSLLVNLENLAKYAESESVRLEATKYLISEAMGREDAKVKMPAFSGTNILVIEDGLERAKRAKEAVAKAMMNREAIAV